ncbi:reverse transcriptase domain-containing protein, partial [Tanacetum coccineum]
CVPKKGGMTVVENEDNELIPTRCTMTIFHDMIEEIMEVFMDNFSVFRDSFSSYLSHLDKMVKRCEDTNLVLNWEKCRFMVKEGIVLGHKISKSGIEVDKAKVDVIAKLPHLTFVKGVRRAENLAVDHLFRLENPHQGDLQKKETNETFPLETLRMISFHDDVFTAKKPLISSRLAIIDPPGDIMVRTTPLRKFGTPVAIGRNRGTHFCNDQFAKVMLKYGVTHRLSTAYHLQTSG